MGQHRSQAVVARRVVRKGTVGKKKGTGLTRQTAGGQAKRRATRSTGSGQAPSTRSGQGKKAARGKPQAAVRKRKASPSGRPRARPVPKPPPVVAVGDAVLMAAGEGDQVIRQEARTPGRERAGEATEGIVCSIREIASGKLVGKTSGELSHYVLEVLHQRTFQPQFSSSRNTGRTRGSDSLGGNPTWVKLRGLLREMAHSNRFVTQSSGALLEEPFASLLDGWRVVKLRAQMIELREL